jgi:hypothetical protein
VIALVVFAVLAVVGTVASIRAITTDGYHRVPTR